MFEERAVPAEQFGKYLISKPACQFQAKEEPQAKENAAQPLPSALVAHHIETGEELSVVNVFRQNLTDRQLAEFQHELLISQHLGPLPNIRRLVDIVETQTGLFLFYSCPPHFSQRRQNPASSGLLESPWEIYDHEDDDEALEDAPFEMTLMEYVQMMGKIPEEEAKLIFAQMAAAVGACHERFVVHRDLKLPAFLIDPESKHVRLSGFSNAAIIASPEELMRDRRGSPAYVSPEILYGRPYSGQLADSWALGVILYALLCGTFPYVDSSPKQLFEKIMKSGASFPSHLSQPSISLLRSLLSHPPQNRLSPFLALNHPWLRSCSNEDDQMVPDME